MTDNHHLAKNSHIKRLADDHPALFKGENPTYAVSVPPGWQELVDKLCTDIERAMGDSLPDISVIQVKQKFGSLRFYCSLKGAEQRQDLALHVQALIDAASRAAELTCEQCGKPGAHRNIKGLEATLCDAHHRQQLRGKLL